jgi:hypothetical protein
MYKKNNIPLESFFCKEINRYIMCKMPIWIVNGASDAKSTSQFKAIQQSKDPPKFTLENILSYKDKKIACLLARKFLISGDQKITKDYLIKLQNKFNSAN